MALLQCKYARRNGASIVRASGEIDLNSLHLLEEMLGRAIDDSQVLVVDLREASHIDSTGLHMLVGAHERCMRRKMKMAVVFTSSHLWRIFSVLSLQDMFHIFPSVDAALQALSHPAVPVGPPARAKETDISIGSQD